VEARPSVHGGLVIDLSGESSDMNITSIHLNSSGSSFLYTIVSLSLVQSLEWILRCGTSTSSNSMPCHAMLTTMTGAAPPPNATYVCLVSKQAHRPPFNDKWRPRNHDARDEGSERSIKTDPHQTFITTNAYAFARQLHQSPPHQHSQCMPSIRSFHHHHQPHQRILHDLFLIFLPPLKTPPPPSAPPAAPSALSW
jgi:hypothetical protein